MIRRAFLLLLALACVSCSSSSSSGDGGGTTVTPCNDNPWECAAGQTCAPDTQSSFACLDSAAGVAEGSACKSLVDMPTCGDGLFCLALASSGSFDGTCVRFCDPSSTNHTCATGAACTKIGLAGGNGPSVHVCYVPGGAGGTSGAGGNGAGGTGAGGEAGTGQGGSVSGGSPGVGGAATGGQAAGGNPTGTGGNATGGQAAGGNPTGGTGGSEASGGNPAGGAGGAG